ncbi:uncharacterized protein HD556DRAFT_908691 [Suillus plorans]|uniref:Uncharacterized protein n=1 Tax=Suillus plorans TaxID=116603 RepID=A0A9P7AGF4_9AGAM|nr:uncharacterized protein HD556DRAFT_908691 [Suillus plorans]KAG1788233.1 hypothetical protein HD556DRAFT_908691 [Suillus plorans]
MARVSRSGGSLLVIGHYLLSFASLKENCCWNRLTTKSFASTRMACFNYPYGSRRSRSLVRSGAARCCKSGLTLTAPLMKGHAIGLSRLRKTLIDVLDTCQAREHMLPNCNRGRRRLGNLRLAKPGLGYFAGVPPGTPNLASCKERLSFAYDRAISG